MNLQPVSALFAELCAVTGADDALLQQHKDKGFVRAVRIDDAAVFVVHFVSSS